MGDYSHRVQIILENIIKGEGKVQEMTKNYQVLGQHFGLVSKSMINHALKQEQSLKSLAKKNRFLSEWSEKLGVNAGKVNQIMGLAGIRFNKAGKAVEFTGEPVKNLAIRMKKAEIESRRFNMAALSMMFAGMALQRSMKGLLQPAMEASGIFDTFSDILITLFEPIMDAIAPMIEWFADSMDRLPSGFRLVIGVIAVLLLGLGAMLALGGQLILAYGGLTVQMAKLTLALQGATAGFAAMGTSAAIAGTTASVAFAPFLLIAIIIIAAIAAIIAIWYYWEDIVDGFNNTLENFGKVVRMTIVSAALFFGWLNDRLTTFSEGFVGAWDWLSTFVSDSWGSLTDWLDETFGDTAENLDETGSEIESNQVSLWQRIKDKASEMWTTLKSKAGEIWENIKTSVGEKVETLKQNLGTKWEEMKTKASTKWEEIKTKVGEKVSTIKQNLSTKWEEMKQKTSTTWEDIKTKLSTKWEEIKEIFEKKGKDLNENTKTTWQGMKITIRNAIQKIIDFINGLIDAWNRLSFTVPSITLGSGKYKYTFGGGTYGVPTIGHVPDLPELAGGGIVRRPTMAMIGERGPEAVVPLNKGMGTTINFSPVYNITVSDKYEFERMIKFNNTKLVEDLRRIVEI